MEPLRAYRHRDKQSKIMQQVYNRTTPEEQRWIARIILKGLDVSLLGKTPHTHSDS